MTRRQGLTIGRLAAQPGVNLKTVRYYERVGLMPAPDRTSGGHRDYRPADRMRLAAALEEAVSRCGEGDAPNRPVIQVLGGAQQQRRAAAARWLLKRRAGKRHFG
jgi:DNA-binding transcriptional MerR regulator